MKLLLTAALFTATVFAGPPMICHPMYIGTEKSLPWGTGGGHWDARLPSYDRSHLIVDTLQLLRPETPVIARMETLRRAVIYAAGEPVATELAQALEARAASDPLAFFDAGYFIEAVHQLGPMIKKDPLKGSDGYTLAKKSLSSAKDTASVEYGLSLMRADTHWPNDHYRNAVAGVKKGTLLAANIRQFEERR